jgi:hypothetical protein
MQNNPNVLNTKKHCRSCNYIIGHEAKRCPACNQSQSRTKETVALSVMVLIVCLVAYWQFFQSSDSKPEPASSHSESYTGAPKSTPIASSPSPAPKSQFEYQPVTKSGGTQIRVPSPNSTRRPTKAASRQVNYQGTAFRQQAGEYPFYVAEKKWNPQRKKYEFQRKGAYGSEILLKVDARRYFLSENQNDYPEPASGCGPTALLNLYIWYSKFGLIQESIRHANPTTYKRLKFQEIDRKLLNIQRASRSQNGGTNTLAAIVAIDELVQESTRNSTRLREKGQGRYVCIPRDRSVLLPSLRFTGPSNVHGERQLESTLARGS